MPNVENHKELVPFEHYTGLFEKLDPVEATERCGVKYDPDAQVFAMRLLYVDYQITWPKFSIKSAAADGFALYNLPAQMLLIRYLLEGRRSVGTGAFLPYREMPWGEVYLKPFTGRCLNRAAFTFGTRLDAFRAAAAQLPAIPLDKGDASFQLEIMPGYDVRLIVWEGDDEFPPKLTLMWDRNAIQFLHFETTFFLQGDLLGRLKNRMGC